MRISKTFVDQITLPIPTPEGKATQSFYRDSAIPGFGLRVTSGGAKSFIIEKRIQGRVKRITLGRYGNLTVEQARRLAMEQLGEIVQGKDPQAEKKARRVKTVTLLEAFEDYLTTRKDLKASSIHDYRRSIDGAFKDWQNKPLVEITKDMVELRHRKLGQRSHARANNAMRVLRAVFNHARAKYEDAQGNPVIALNPVERLSQNRAWYKVERRQTLIKAHQLAGWYQATLELNNETTRDYLHCLLFTGLRRSEASRLAWTDVDFTDQTITINETKNHQTHILPLSDHLLALLQRRHAGKTSPFVFPSKTKRGYLVEPRTAVQRVSEISGITFTLHDLRRTFITIAESLDIPAYALKRLLNHKDGNDVTAGYIVPNVDRLREPMQKITDFLLNAMDQQSTPDPVTLEDHGNGAGNANTEHDHP